jgi:hypothetical protein
MATLGNIPLSQPGAPTGAAAAFVLTQPVEQAAAGDLRDTSFELMVSCRYLVVRFPSAADATDCYSKGLELAQEVLDRLSILGRGDYTLRRPEDEHILWWTQAGKTNVRIFERAVLAPRVGPIAITVHDDAGNEIRHQPVVPGYSLAFRYYRLSQTDDDIYDAYRHMYLAFEMLLSERFPLKHKENEKDWLRRSLASCWEEIDLNDLTVKASIRSFRL